MVNLGRLSGHGRVVAANWMDMAVVAVASSMSLTSGALVVTRAGLGDPLLPAHAKGAGQG